MDKAYFDRFIKARNAMFEHEGKVVNPTTLTYDAEKPYVLFPDIRCVNKDCSLVTKPSAGLLELRTKVGKQWTRLYLSIFLEDYFIGVRDEEVELEVGQVTEKVSCPHCKESLIKVATTCRRCKTDLIRLAIHTLDQQQFVMNICARRGCRSHYIELGSYDFRKRFLQALPLRSPGDFEPMSMSGRIPRAW